MSSVHGEHVVATAHTVDWLTAPFTVTFTDDPLPVDDPSDSDEGGSVYLVTLIGHTDYSLRHGQWSLNIQRHDNTATARYLWGIIDESAATIENVQHVSGDTFSFDVDINNGGDLLVIVSRALTRWPNHT